MATSVVLQMLVGVVVCSSSHAPTVDPSCFFILVATV